MEHKGRGTSATALRCAALAVTEDQVVLMKKCARWQHQEQTARLAECLLVRCSWQCRKLLVAVRINALLHDTTPAHTPR